MRIRRTSVVEFGYLGHHADYLGLLVDEWFDARPLGVELILGVTHDFVRFHGDVARRIESASSLGLRLHVLDAEAQVRIEAAPAAVSLPFTWLRPPGPPIESAPRVRWDVAARIARDTGAERLFFMELDAVLPALAGRCPVDVPVSGILFRSPSSDDVPTAAHRHWLLHQRALISSAAGHPRLERILTLDPRAASETWTSSFRSRILPLVDPLPVPARCRDEGHRDIARRRLAIPDGRLVVLQFGHLAARKGYRQVLQALAALDASERARLSLQVYGAWVRAETADFEAEIGRIEALGVHVAWADRFVDAEMTRDLFDAADVVMAAYRNHAGMSGVLLHAAAAGVPLIAQEHGLIGHLVRRHRLGRAVDTTNHRAIVAALREFLSRGISDFDPSAAMAFAQMHDPSIFKRTLLGALFEDRLESSIS